MDVLIAQEGAYVIVHRGWLDETKADELFSNLVDGIEWEKQDLKIMGKIIPEPRLTFPMGDDGLIHKYTGVAREVKPWVPSVKAIRDRVKEEFGFSANSCLLNYYQTGEDYIGAHADKETTPPEHFVVTISLGHSRDIIFKQKSLPKNTIKTTLNSGDACIMSGTTQQFWLHSIPKRKKVTSGRIALTFRELRPSMT